MYNNDDFNRFGLFNDEFYKRVRKMFDFDGFMNFDNFDELFNRQIDMNDPNVEKKGYSVSYKFGTGMDKPEYKIEGDLTEEEVEQIKNNIENLNFNFGFNLKPSSIRNDTNQLDFKEVSKRMENETTADEDIQPKYTKKQNKPIEEPFHELYEEENETVIIVELPGIEKENINISIDPDNSKGLIVHAEGTYVDYEARINLNRNFKMENVKGKSKNGIFQITISK